jgi:hypothetical protein
MMGVGSEPVMVWVAGGGTVVQAVMQVWIAFGHSLSQPQQAAITTLVGVVLGLIARSYVTPLPSMK